MMGNSVAVIVLPEDYLQRWVIVGENGEASFDMADLDFRLAGGAGQVFRFRHPEWPLYVEGHVSYSPHKRTLNPVLALIEPEPEGWLALLKSFGSASDRRPSRLLLTVIVKVLVSLSGCRMCGSAVVITPHSFDADTFEYFTDLLDQTACVDVWLAADDALLDVDIAAQPAPWVDAALCALATESDQKTGILKERRSGNQTALGMSIEVYERNSWPIFVVGLQRAEVPLLKIEGFFFHLELQDTPSIERKNDRQFSRYRVKISEVTLPLDGALDRESVDQIRTEFAAKAASLGAKIKEAKVRALLAPGVEELLQEEGVEAEDFQEIWCVVQEQPDLLQGTYVYQSSQVVEIARKSEDEEKRGQDKTHVLDHQEISQAQKKPQEKTDFEIGEGPWDRDFSHLDEIEGGKHWTRVSHIVEDAIAQTDRSEDGRVRAIREAIRSLVVGEKIVGYPMLEGMIERLGFELVDCSKNGGPMIQCSETDIGPFLLGEATKANPLGGSSYHAGHLIEREEGNLQQAVRYLDWAAAHPMWGPEGHYLKNLTTAIHMVISKNGESNALGSDPTGLFLRLKYFEWLPRGKPEILGNWALIADDIGVIDDIQSPEAEGVEAQLVAAAKIWKGDLKNGEAFSSQGRVPSQNKES